MTWKSQPVGHAGLCGGQGALSGGKASVFSLATSYLELGQSQDTRNEPVTDSCL